MIAVREQRGHGQRSHSGAAVCQGGQIPQDAQVSDDFFAKFNPTLSIIN
jgi:hypothetical protein